MQGWCIFFTERKIAVETENFAKLYHQQRNFVSRQKFCLSRLYSTYRQVYRRCLACRTAVGTWALCRPSSCPTTTISYRFTNYTWPCVFGTLYKVTCPVYACTGAYTGQLLFTRYYCSSRHQEKLFYYQSD